MGSIIMTYQTYQTYHCNVTKKSICPNPVWLMISLHHGWICGISLGYLDMGNMAGTAPSPLAWHIRATRTPWWRPAQAMSFHWKLCKLFIVVPHVRATWDYLSLLVILFRECFRCRLFSQQWCVFLSWSLHDAITSLVNMITKDKTA
jgi:hypothetical protein